MKKNKIENLKVTKIEQSRVEITASIPVEYFNSFRKQALDNINNEITVDGFRKGKVPENILISKVGEMSILEEMAELALSEIYPEIIIDEKIDAIGRPEIHITKIASDNPLEFKIITSIIPEINLSDYKKIAKEEMSKPDETLEITEKELEESILKIRKSRVDHSGHDHENISPEEHDKFINASLPELNDEFVKGLGDFKDVEDFKTKIKVALMNDKKEQGREKKRIGISDKIIDSSSCDMPEILIENEIFRIESQFKEDVSRMGVSIEDYLKHAKKTIEDLRKDWHPYALKKAKLQLILNKIAKLENIVVDKTNIEKEVEHILEHYKDADKEKAYTYAETVLTNEAVFKFLESQK